MKLIYPLLILLLFSCESAPSSSVNTTPLYDYDVEEKIKELGITLPEPGLPKDKKINLLLANRIGDMVYLSGNGPVQKDGTKITGKVGTDLTIEEGYQAARATAINHISVLKAEIGDLNKVEQFVKVFGMVNAAPEFTEQPAVVNGYSDLMVEVFGERGRHARSAVGMASLPWNIACEMEAVVKIRN